MIQLGPQHFLAETAEDLPKPRPGRPVYLDCETRSRDDSLRSGGNQAYLGDRAAMWGCCFEDGPAVAVPYRMRDGRNLPVEVVQRWLADVTGSCSEWRNHNVKFDAHMAWHDGAPVPKRLACTLTMAKIKDSDRFSHGLKELSRDWLARDYSSEDAVTAWLDGYKLPRGAKARDYALVPTDILGHYNCDDVLANRQLFEHCMEHLPTEVMPTWEMEQQLTPVLWDMEHKGLRVDPTELQKERLLSLRREIDMATRLNELTGMEWADSVQFTYGLFVGTWGLPVLARDKKSGNPSFDKDALKLYLVHPDIVIDPRRVETVQLIQKLRAEDTYRSLFVESFLENMDPKGYIHTSYNQVIRTGRMSAKEPNTQQFDARAKRLILADGPGMGFLDCDYSQIEFRFIVHYIKNEAAIRAYNENPDTDFHEWAREMCRFKKRKPAKTMNFSVSFGAGMRNTIGQLAADPDVIEEVSAEVQKLIDSGEIKEERRLDAFKKLCWTRGENVYRTYHQTLPELKPKSEEAGAVARKMGFVKNLYGRRRHLPTRAAHVAFNTVCQGGAMDLIKRRMIQTAERNWPELRDAGITMRVNVHDAVVFHGPMGELARMRPQVLERLQAREERLRVPIRCASELTEGRWATK